jgi:hypothetical protein
LIFLYLFQSAGLDVLLALLKALNFLRVASIKSKKQESTGVSPLKNKEGFIHSDTTSKAEILSEQFQSVYTKENTSTMPDKIKDGSYKLS